MKRPTFYALLPKCLWFAFLPLFVAGFSTTAEATEYVFTSIANSTSGPCHAISCQFSFPVINDSGTVAFFDNSSDAGVHIFSGNGGPLTTIVTRMFSFNPIPASQVSIADNGNVAFNLGGPPPSFGNSIVVGNGGALTTIATSVPVTPLCTICPVTVSNPVINHVGAVAYQVTTGGNEAPSVNLYSGGTTTTIYNGFPIGFHPLSPITLNDAGTIAFAAGDPGLLRAILVGNGGPFTTIAVTGLVDPHSPFPSDPGFGFSKPVINNSGTVAFDSGTGTGTYGIFTGNGQIGPNGLPIVTTIATANVNGPGFTSFTDTATGRSALSINNSGQVAFVATLASGAPGIFTGPDPVANKVIAGGDLLFGSSVRFVNSSWQALNDTGQITFIASLLNGNNLVARANPVGPRTPLLPDTISSNSFLFDFFLPASVTDPVFIDPAVAIGYDYLLGAGSPNFASVLLPIVDGQSLFRLHLFDNSPDVTVEAGVMHSFGPGGVNHFEILDISPNAGLDPNNPLAFETGLTFEGSGEIQISMTPLTANGPPNVPEPASWVLFGVGIVAVGGALKLRGRGRE